MAGWAQRPLGAGTLPTLVAAAASVLAWCSPLRAQREFAVVPPPGTDFTAYRFDTKIIGWNDDFTELATVAIEIFRDARSTQRGDVTLLVFEIGASVPKHKAFLLNHTQGAMPSDPMPLLTIGARDWCAGSSMQENWGRRPLPRRPTGGMRVETLWTPVELPDGTCQPRVGFLLRHEGSVRYHGQHPLRVWAPCHLLHLTDEQTQWANRSLAAAILRFHFTPAAGDPLFNEHSARFALSASWRLGSPLRILVRSPRPQRPQRRLSTKLARLVRRLRALGSVRVQQRQLLDAHPRAATVVTRPHLEPLRQWIARHALDAETSADVGVQPVANERALPDDTDILVVLGSGSTPPIARARAPRPREDAEGAYLTDWALH